MEEKAANPENSDNKVDDINIDDLFVSKKVEDSSVENKEVETEDKGEENKAQTIDPSIISKIASEAASKAVEAVTTVNNRESQVNSFLATEEGKLYAPYSEQIKRAAKASEYSHLPISNVVGLVLGTKIATIGAKAEQEASKQQKGNQGGSGSGAARSSNPGEKVSAWTLPKADFEQVVADAKSGKFKAE